MMINLIETSPSDAELNADLTTSAFHCRGLPWLLGNGLYVGVRRSPPPASCRRCRPLGFIDASILQPWPQRRRLAAAKRRGM